MKQSDEAVEKVLGGLGGVEVPAGLERRVLKGAHDGVARRSRSFWRRGRKLVPAVLCGVALAVAAGVGVRSRLGSEKTVPRTEVARALRVAGSPLVMTPSIPPRVKARAQPARAMVRRKGGKREADSVALAEMRAPSMVAPPMGLTAEEKLLLRIVHRGDPEEVALLSPEMRLRQDAEGNAEFQCFFGLLRDKANQKP